MPDIPDNEPLEITAGDTVEWTRNFDDYPASDSWVLTYALLHVDNPKISLTASASGDAHLISETAATTAAWYAGEYRWNAYVTKGAERYLVDSGTMQVNADLSALDNYDGRSYAKQQLDKLRDVYNNWDGKTAEYQIGDRRVRFKETSDILAELDRWERIYQQEQDAERLAAGLGTNKKVQVRF